MKIIIGVSVIVLLLIAGCSAVMRNIGRSIMEKSIESASNGEANVDINDDGSMKITTKDGEFTSGTDVPDSWPKDVPTYPAAKVQFSGSGNYGESETGLAVVFQSSDDAPAIVSFYKKQLAAEGWKIESTMEAQGTSIFSATKDSRRLSASITSADGSSTITLAVQQQ